MAKYAIADLHGQYNLFQQIKEYIKSDDLVYVLGDCGDRGKDGWNIIKEVISDSRFFYLKGNHEDLLYHAMLSSGNQMLCYANSGKTTFEDWKNKESGDKKWAHILNELSYEVRYRQPSGRVIIMCHAGYTPRVNWSPSMEQILWDRKHFYKKWDEENFPNTFMIHGHTGCPMMREFIWEEFPEDYNFSDPTIIKYCNRHKINLDLTSFITGKIALLNLETLEPIYFYDDKVYKSYLKELEAYSDPENFWS